ncbi:hypothetical protein JW926_15975 [Candidatus Sumerlaeota bacterium]|nr:hypothetical protein [Candidatus Sumerlaeota bacterium]
MEKELTFEHVPPKKAFNDKPIFLKMMESLLSETKKTKGKTNQRGFGEYTLCKKCNNETGAWYAKSYIDFVYQSFCFLSKLSEPKQNQILLPFHIYPLRIIKQIICMFFSVNGNLFCDIHPNLVSFVLNKEKIRLKCGVKIYCYLTNTTFIKRCGIASMIIQDKGIFVFSEITYAPLGLIMTIDSKPPDDRLCDISYFANYEYNYCDTFFLNIPFLPANTPFPIDFRTEKEIGYENIKKIKHYFNI